MDKRSELVEAVVECVCRWRDDDNRTEASDDALIAAIDALRAHDAARVEGLNSPVTPDGWHTVTGEAVRRVLDALPDGVSVKWSGVMYGKEHGDTGIVVTTFGLKRIRTPIMSENDGIRAWVESLTFPVASLPPDFDRASIGLNTSDGSAAPIEQDGGKVCNVTRDEFEKLKGVATDAGEEVPRILTQIATLRREVDAMKTRTRHMRPFPWKCQDCGAVEVVPVFREKTLDVKFGDGLVRTCVPAMPIYECRKCKEATVGNTGDEMITHALHATLNATPAPAPQPARYVVVPLRKVLGVQYYGVRTLSGMWLCDNGTRSNVATSAIGMDESIALAVRDALESQP